MDPSTDPESLRLLADSLRTTMTAASGAKLDAALTDLGWRDMLDEMPDVAIPLVFRLLGETGAHAPAAQRRDAMRGRRCAREYSAAAVCRRLLGGMGA